MGFGQFEDRGREYVAFVRRLHEASSAVNSQIRFITGSTPLYWVGWILVVVAGLLGALLIGALAVGGPRTPPLQVVLVRLGVNPARDGPLRELRSHDTIVFTT